MNFFLLALTIIFGVIVSGGVQSKECSRNPKYPWYSLTDQALKFVGSVPRVLCHPGPAQEIVRFNCKTTGNDKFYNVDFSNPRSYRAMDRTAKWAFVAHGFLGSCYRDWPIEMLKVLSASEPMNVCCVDWSEWAKCNYVNDALDHVYQVGDYLAETVDHMHRTLDINLNRFILIGHSFGGIIIGIAGKHFKNPRLPLGIALDPAGILYTRVIEVPANRRLNATDFDVTKAIYTDELGLGSTRKMGSVNIFANGGLNQPNCDRNIFPCSHFTAVLFFIESMRRNQKEIYPIISKDGTVQDYFTMYANDAPGDYDLKTTKCFPYNSPPLNNNK